MNRSIPLFKHFAQSPSLRYPIAVAPMIDVSTPHYLHLLNLIHPEHCQYTEMIHCRAITRYKANDLDFKLGLPPTSNRVIQLGGNSAEEFVKSAKVLEEWGFNELNINLGCPSDNVQSGNFGVKLMKEPFTVIKILNSLYDSSVKIPITLKIRIGVDDLDAPGFLENFIQSISYYTPVKHIIIHCRKAWLKGLSPKKNRNIPPLKYGQVYKIIEKYKNLEFTVNGGISSIEEIQNNLNKYSNLKQVMLGRKYMNDPMFLKESLIATNPNISSKDFNSPDFILKQYSEYSDLQHDKGHRVGVLIQPTMNLLPSKLGTLYKQNLPHLLPVAIKQNWKPSKLFINLYEKSLSELNNKV